MSHDCTGGRSRKHAYDLCFIACTNIKEITTALIMLIRSSTMEEEIMECVFIMDDVIITVSVTRQMIHYYLPLGSKRARRRPPHIAFRLDERECKVCTGV